MQAFKIDVETFAEVRTVLLAGAEGLIEETRMLRRITPAAGIAHQRAGERVETLWNDFVDGVENWAQALESSIARLGTLGRAASETDMTVADALDKLA